MWVRPAADSRVRQAKEQQWPTTKPLRHWQKTLDQPQNVEPGAYGRGWGRIQLDEIRKYAAQWEKQSGERQTIEA